MFVGISCQNDGEITAEKLSSTNLEDAQKEFALQIANEGYKYISWDIFVNDVYQNLEEHIKVIDTNAL